MVDDNASKMGRIADPRKRGISRSAQKNVGAASSNTAVFGAEKQKGPG